MTLKPLLTAGLLALGASQTATAQFLDIDDVTLPLQIPLSLSNLTVDTIGAKIQCGVMTGSGQSVASGTTYIFEYPADSEGSAVRRLLPEGANAIQVPVLEGYTDIVEVQLEPIGNGVLIDAWENGVCELSIMAIPITDEPNVELTVTFVQDCTDNVSLTVSFCARKGSDSVRTVNFSRDVFRDVDADN